MYVRHAVPKYIHIYVLVFRLYSVYGTFRRMFFPAKRIDIFKKIKYCHLSPKAGPRKHFKNPWYVLSPCCAPIFLWHSQPTPPLEWVSRRSILSESNMMFFFQLGTNAKEMIFPRSPIVSSSSCSSSNDNTH